MEAYFEKLRVVKQWVETCFGVCYHYSNFCYIPVQGEDNEYMPAFRRSKNPNLQISLVVSLMRSLGYAIELKTNEAKDIMTIIVLW